MKSTSPTEYTLQYKPHEPGIYLLNVKFGDEHVTGTLPFSLICMHNLQGRINRCAGGTMGGGPAASPPDQLPNFYHTF